MNIDVIYGSINNKIRNRRNILGQRHSTFFQNKYFTLKFHKYYNKYSTLFCISYLITTLNECENHNITLSFVNLINHLLLFS